MNANLKLKSLLSQRKTAFLMMLFCSVFVVCCQKGSIQTENTEQKKTQTQAENTEQKKTQTQTQTPQLSKQKKAEEAVDKLMQRFYETLDFETIWKEGYVTDEKLRHLEVEAIIFKYLYHKSMDKVSHEAKERAYVAMGNFWQNMSALSFTADKETIDKVLDDKVGTLYESMTRRGKPFSTSKELDEDMTAKMNRISEIIRPNINPKNYNTEFYKDRLKQFEAAGPLEPKQIERIREVFIPACLKKDAEIYVVEREIFYFYLIEENGTFKVLTILHRRRD